MSLRNSSLLKVLFEVLVDMVALVLSTLKDHGRLTHYFTAGRIVALVNFKR